MPSTASFRSRGAMTGVEKVTDNSVVHDAEKLLTDLREHLARHDKPIGFLFGAGTSCAVRVVKPGGKGASPLIPDVAGLTSQCKRSAIESDPAFGGAWEELVGRCRARGESPNIENILSRLAVMRDAVGPCDQLAGLGFSDLGRLEKTVRRTIARLVNPEVCSIPAQLPHRELARWLIRVTRQYAAEIFTVNYDILLELAFEAERVPVFDGFVGSYEPFFHPDSLRHADVAPGSNWTRLWKMHGSVTWRRVNKDGRTRIVRGSPGGSGEMIFPSLRKYDESRQQPYSAFMDRLARFLELDDALLVVAGFGFGDEHINNLVFGALENFPRTHMFALQYEDPSTESDLFQRGIRQHNIVVAGPQTGVVGGRAGGWRETSTVGTREPGTDESDSAPDSAGSRPDKVGESAPESIDRIGDFTRFCRFLRSLA